MNAGRSEARRGGLAAILVGIAALAVVGLEIRRQSLGFEDPDNPRTMLSFFRQYPDLYTATGILWVLIAIALVVVVLVLWRVIPAAGSGLLIPVGTVFGLFSSAFFFAQGVLRVQSPGTILHIANLNEESGEAAYAAVQMAGTQGFGSAGGLAFAVWAVAVAVGTWRARTLPRVVALLSVLPALFLLLVLFGGLTDVEALNSQALYLLYLASVVVGLPLWCIGLGIVLLRGRAS